jgi:muconolactone delta-isomerase
MQASSEYPAEEARKNAAPTDITDLGRRAGEYANEPLFTAGKRQRL